MDTRYLHDQHEQTIYKLWEKNGAFTPKKSRGKGQKPFVIMMPPPNANDPLHIGHAMFIAIEDILIRFHRMMDDDTLWLPGTDHAGIETQFVFEKKLKKEDKSRFDFDRETLYSMIKKYVEENSKIAKNQMKRLGASADWSRFKFMLDENIVEEVIKTFKKFHEKTSDAPEGLIYRDYQPVNYCVHCGTSYSELEINYQEREDPLYTIQYGPLQVATARPETIFADVALAINPEDKNPEHRKYLGKNIKVKFPWNSEEIEVPVIADKDVSIDFGTGVLKITPYHDRDDWKIWQKHRNSLPYPKSVIQTNGKLFNVPTDYELKITEARKKVVEDLGNLVVKIENKSHNVGTCYRCGRVIETLPLPQFFIRVKALVKPILEALENKEFKIHGAGYDKILKHWLENLRDWNISRQIVWGIRFPVWYEVNSNKEKIWLKFIDKNNQPQIGTLTQLLKNYSLKQIKAGIHQISAMETADYIISTDEPKDGKDYIQETDTFDTWFSSAQWPFTTLKTNQPGDFERFFPTQVMETGYDILPFWVMRMLMIGKEITGQLPFKDIYLHGLIRDAKGQKMSKSKGNVINPLEITEKYGADALRMALVIRSTPGLDKAVGEQDFRAMRNLTNKIWNASRFVLEHLDVSQKGETEINTQFEKKLGEIAKTVTKNLSKFQIGLAAETAYNEFWHWFCDECIESAKNNKLGGKEIINGLQIFLKLLHPFTPFITEVIWQEIYKKKLVAEPLLITASWPADSLPQ